MNGLAVMPHPMENMGCFSSTEGDVTFERRWLTETDLVGQPEGLLQYQLNLYSAVLDYLPIAVQYPIQIVSPTEIDIDRDAMTIGEPYHFKLGDVYLVAVKQDNGTVDFYAFG